MGIRTLLLCLCIVLAAIALPAQQQSTTSLATLLQQVQAAPNEAHAQTGLAVEVVDEEGKPVASAIVGYFTMDPRDLTASEQQRMELLAPNANLTDDSVRFAVCLLAYCTRYRTDANGRATLPVGDRVRPA